MNNLISRQTLKDLGAECIAKRDENGNLIPLGSIDNLPSVSTKKTGRWKYQKFEGWECMNCGYIVPLYLAPFEYCPKCGAKMEEETETCIDCTNKCIMYEPNMKGCKEVEPQESEVQDADCD